MVHLQVPKLYCIVCVFWECMPNFAFYILVKLKLLLNTFCLKLWVTLVFQYYLAVHSWLIGSVLLFYNYDLILAVNLWNDICWLFYHMHTHTHIHTHTHTHTHARTHTHTHTHNKHMHKHIYIHIYFKHAISSSLLVMYIMIILYLVGMCKSNILLCGNLKSFFSFTILLLSIFMSDSLTLDILIKERNEFHSISYACHVQTKCIMNHSGGS